MIFGSVFKRCSYKNNYMFGKIQQIIFKFFEFLKKNFVSDSPKNTSTENIFTKNFE